MKATRRILVACVAGALLLGCGGSAEIMLPDTTTPIAVVPQRVTTVTIGGRPILDVGDTLTLSATALDAAGAQMADRAAAWSSASTQVATIDPGTGVVHGTGVGSAVITAVIDGESASVVVTVDAAGTDVTPPQLQSLVYAPDSLDPHTIQNILITGRVTDIGSGATEFAIEFRGPTGGSIGCKSHAPGSGTVMDGTWSCTVVVGSGAVHGPWIVEAVELDDANGNVRDVERDELAARGLPTVITIQ